MLDVVYDVINRLTSLSKRYDVNWWTEREVFKALQQYPAIADKYKDIVIEVIKDEEQV